MFKPANALVADDSAAASEDLKVDRKSSNASNEGSQAELRDRTSRLTELRVIIDRSLSMEKRHDALPLTGSRQAKGCESPAAELVWPPNVKITDDDGCQGKKRNTSEFSNGS